MSQDINQAPDATPIVDPIIPEVAPAPEPEIDNAEAKLHEAVEKRKNDAVALEKYANDMVDQKRKANEEAKTWREKFESLQGQIEEEARQRQLAEMSELERKQAEIDARDERIRSLEASVQQKEAERKAREFKLIGDKLGVKDLDIAQYFLDKHLSSLPADEREYELSQFDAETWMRDLKASKPDLFKPAAPLASKKEVPDAPKANSGTPPQEKTQEDKVVKVQPISKSKQDKAEVEALWAQLKAEANGV